MNPFLLQTVTIEPDAIKALSDLGIAVIALLIVGGMAFVVYKALGTIDRYSKALERMNERIAAGQSKDEDLREKNRVVFDKTTANLQKIGDAFDKFHTGIDKRLEDQTDAIRGSDGVLERLKTSMAQITDLSVKTQVVVDSANIISENLESIKEAVGKMNASDDEVKSKIEAIQNQLKELSGAVSSIPAAVGDAERNIIAVIEKRTEPTTRPLPDITQIVKAHNGAEKEKEDVEQNTQAAD